MKDITITGKTIRRELLFLLASFIAAECLNAYSIIEYSRPATELVSMLGYVIFTAIMIYLLLLLVRAAVKLLARLFQRH